MRELVAWRKEQRAALIARRQATEPEQRRRWNAAVEANLRALLSERAPSLLGFYWPFRGEFDARPMVRDLIERSWRAALPVVIEKNRPMIFRPWIPGMAMVDGIWDIPVPRNGVPVVPDIVLAPLVGFDDARYRLGYGGGYFDRTLAALTPRPHAIGVGFAMQEIDTIHPQDFDIPMDAIVTEAFIRRR